MVEFTNAERLNYLLEMALVIHEGINENIDENHELDNLLIEHLKAADHFIVVKKAVQSRIMEQTSENENEHAGGHQSPMAIGNANNQSIGPQSDHSTASPPAVGSSPQLRRARPSAPARRNANRRRPGETQNSKIIRDMRNAVPFATWVNNPK